MAVTFPQTDLPRSVGGGHDGWDGGAGALLLDDYFVTTSDVTVALTGAASTAQAGALSPTLSKVLTASVATALAGSITPAFSYTMSGQSAMRSLTARLVRRLARKPERLRTRLQPRA